MPAKPSKFRPGKWTGKDKKTQSPTREGEKKKRAETTRREVMKLHRRGTSERDIADKVGTSRSSVRNHISQSKQGREAQSAGNGPQRTGARARAWRRQKRQVDQMNKRETSQDGRRHFVKETYRDGKWNYSTYKK